MNRMTKRVLTLAIMLIALVALPVAAMAVVNVSTANELVEVMNKINSHEGDLIINIEKNIDVTGMAWSTKINGYGNGTKKITINGNGHTISGMTNPLIDGTWAGKSELEINNLTIADSNIVQDPNDEKGDVGVGAFIGSPQASVSIKLNNCHVKDSTVKGGHFTGGLIGWAAGYSGNDGPVFMPVDMENCSVTGSTIEGKGSVGGLIGHATADSWTKVTMKNCSVQSNVITSTGSSRIKAGDLLGTVGVAGQEKTVNDTACTGGVYVENFTADSNDVTSDNTKIKRIFGRFGNENGVLTVKGSNIYDEEAVDTGWDSNSDKGKLVIDGQVNQPVIPSDPSAPAATPVPSTDDLPQTGDESNLALFALLLAMSAMGMLAISRRRSSN